MAEEIEIGLGGGCHWCTEAIFLSLKGVDSGIGQYEKDPLLIWSKDELWIKFYV